MRYSEALFHRNSISSSIDLHSDLGSRTKRWGSIHGQNIIADNVISEVGGSYRLYNLGDESATDSEFLTLETDSNDYRILTNLTGAGVQRDIRLGGYVGGGFRGMRFQPQHNQMQFIFANAVKMSMSASSINVSTTVFLSKDHRPPLTDTYTQGTDIFRWANVYSIDGDFSGTVGAGTVKGQVNNLTLQSNGGTSKISLAESGGVTITSQGSIYQQFTTAGVSYRRDCLPTFDNANSLGLTTNRWSDVFATNGSFTGTLDTEVGGEIRLFKLGSNADVAAGDTEYLSFRNDIVQTQESYVLEPVGTGAGTSARQFYIMGSNNRSAGHILLDRFGAVNLKYGNTSNIYVSNGYTRSGANFYPDVDDTHELGLATNRLV